LNNYESTRKSVGKIKENQIGGAHGRYDKRIKK
jgi:hypothetical protein